MTRDGPEDQLVTIICAWCGKLLQEGGPRRSHGICDECLPIVLKDVLTRLDDEPEPDHSADQPPAAGR